MHKEFLKVVVKIVAEAVMARFVLGTLTLVSAWFFINSPGCKAALAAVISKLQAAPVAVAASTALPKFSEDELAAPPINGEADIAAPYEAPAASAPAAAAATEAGSDDTFELVMAIYENDEKEQARETITN